MAEQARSVREELSSLKLDRRAPPPKKRRVPRFVWAIALSLLALGGAVLWRLTLGAPTVVSVAYAERSEGGEASAPAAGVVLTGSGYVVTGEKYISIGVRVPGRIDAYLVEESQAVTKGQALVQLDKRDYEAALSRARAARELASANAQLAEIEAKRIRALAQQNVAAQSQLDVKESQLRVAKAQVQQAEAALREAEIALDYTTLRAPRDGVVLAKFKEVGEIAVPGGFAGAGDLIRIADLTDLRAEVDVNEVDLARVKLGQRAEVTPDSFPDSHYDAEVVKLYPQVNRQKGTLKVEVRLLERDDKLRPDSSVRVAFLAPEAAPEAPGAPPAAVITVPRASVQDGAVWVVSESKLRQQRVALGGERADSVVVREGLLGGEAVVVSAEGTLEAGRKVEVAN
ncbi:MAG: efflux RND transporter periplasmic adaptor subunit [Deltaproteobacteria bacterium]|nr:efflux RND transporter periplasmic adaptor subunit [Deltaproteobacteria bacterium]